MSGRWGSARSRVIRAEGGIKGAGGREGEEEEGRG